MKSLRRVLTAILCSVCAIAVLYGGAAVWRVNVGPMPFDDSWDSRQALAWAIRIGWLIAMTMGAILLVRWQVRSHRQKAWTASGKCRRCGYDLRASPNTCPECGERIADEFCQTATHHRPSRASTILKISLIVLVCGCSAFLSLNTNTTAYVYLRVLWPARDAIADAWHSRAFDAEAWKAQSMASASLDSRNPRGDMLADLLRRHAFEGMRITDVESLLGKPDRDGFYDATDKAYYLGERETFLFPESAWLVLRLDGFEQVREIVVVCMDDPRHR